MAKKAAPWYWAARHGWYVLLDGRRHFLGEQPDKAAKPEKSKKTGRWNSPPVIDQAFRNLVTSGSPEYGPADEEAVVNILDDFIVWVKENRTKLTASRYQDFCQDFVNAKPDAKGLKFGQFPITRLTSRQDDPTAGLVVPGRRHNVEMSVAVQIDRDRLEGLRQRADDVLLPRCPIARFADVFAPDDLVRVGLPRRRQEAEGHDDVRVAVAVHVYGMTVRGARRRVVDDVSLPGLLGWIAGVLKPGDEVHRRRGAEQVGLAVAAESCGSGLGARVYSPFLAACL
jgi:hypothetical protein